MQTKIPPSPTQMTTATTLHRPAAAKRLKRHHNHAAAAERHDQSLLPGLPDDVAHLCLSLVPPSSLYSVCRSWRRLIYSPSFPPFPALYSLFLSPEENLKLSSFDPISCQWLPLPPPPLRLLPRHPAFLSRKLPIQSVSVAGKIVLLAATADQFLPALTKPLVFDSQSQIWGRGPSLSSPRRWCAAGVLRQSVYVASGVGSLYDNDVARSAERWDLYPRRFEPRRRWGWEKLEKLRDPKFSREAVDAIGWKGKLCMVNVKGNGPKEGIVYDAEKDSWEEMLGGMVAGWRGPAAAMAEETIYAVDESRGLLKKYDEAKDAWVELVQNELLRSAQQVAAAAGRVCVLCADGMRIAVVDVTAPPPSRVWVVEAPPGLEAVRMHVLPRLSLSDD